MTLGKYHITYLMINCGNGLVPSGQQAITWTKVDQVPWHQGPMRKWPITTNALDVQVSRKKILSDIDSYFHKKTTCLKIDFFHDDYFG